MTGEKAAIPIFARASAIRRLALEDFIARALARAVKKHVQGNRGSGRGGQIIIATSSQRVLRRNALLVDGDGQIEARLLLGLPAYGRRIAAQEAAAIFFQELPRVVAEACHYKTSMEADLARHVYSIVSQKSF